MAQPAGNLAVRLGRIAEDHSAHIDSMLAEFQARLEEIVTRAQARTLAELQSRLSIRDGIIARSKANLSTLRSIDEIFAAEMDAAGYRQLVSAFVKEFPSQLPYFEEALDVMRSAMKNPIPELSWAKADVDYLASGQTAAADSLGSVVQGVGAGVQQKALFSLGGLPMADLAELLARGLQRTLPQAIRIAETAISVHYRMIAERGFEIVERGLPEGALKYSYYGPNDKLTRPFCRHLIAATKNGKLYTRKQIEEMENDQLPNPFITGGGYNCRHSWALHAAEAREAA